MYFLWYPTIVCGLLPISQVCDALTAVRDSERDSTGLHISVCSTSPCFSWRVSRPSAYARACAFHFWLCATGVIQYLLFREGLEDEHVRKILEKCGAVISWKRVEDVETKKPKGFGFCEFEQAEAVMRALRLLNGFSIGQYNELLLKVDSKTQVCPCVFYIACL